MKKPDKEIKKTKVKLPKPFAKAIPEKIWKKRISKYVFVKEHKVLLTELYKNDKGVYKCVGLKTVKQLKQLKTVAKSVKTNRGFVKFGKLSAVLIVLGAIAAFYLIFLSPLVQRSTENLLENIFEAKVAFEKFRFNPAAGKISFSKLTVGDRNHEFRNLFEVGFCEIDLSTTALISRKFVIENIEASDLAVGTDRSTSGLIKKTEREKQEEEQAKDESAEKLNNFLSALQLDTEAIIERESKNLQSLNAATTLPQQYEEKISGYANAVEQGKGDYRKIEKAASDIASIDVKNLKTSDIPKIVKLAGEIQDDIDMTKELISDYSKKVSDAGKDIKQLSADISKVKSGIQHDIDYLAGFFDLSSGQLKNIGSDIVRAQMSRYLGNYYVLANQVLTYAENVSLSQGDKKGGKDKERSKGVKVYFPSTKYPSFWLQKSHFNMADDSFSIDLADISSNPDMIDAPAVFSSAVNSEGFKLTADGTIDMREKSDTRFSLALNTSGMKADLSDQLGSLEINSFTSALAVSGNTTLSANGKFKGKTNIVLTDIKSSVIDNPSLLGKIIRDILRKTKTIKISAGFTITEKNGLKLSLSTNLDSILSGAFSGMAADLKKDATEKVEAYLRDKTGADLSKLEGYKENLQSSLGDLNSTMSGLGKYKKQFEDKKAELEKKKKELENQAKDKVKDTVKDLIPKKLF